MTNTLMLLAALLVLAASSAAANEIVWLDELNLTTVQQEYGEAQAKKSVEGNPLRIDGRTFERGVGTHANGIMSIDLGGGVDSFEAMVGVDDEASEKASIAFRVTVDGKVMFDSGTMRHEAPRQVALRDLRGAKRMQLEVLDGGDGIHSDHADWADAKFTLVPDAKIKPKMLELMSRERPKIARMEPKKEPKINGPRIVGASPGKPFLFLIPATGQAPMRFTASNLPEGLKLDPGTGVITGAIRSPSETVVDLEVSNSFGKAKRSLKIVAGDHKLALTPPMGWNSWNCWAGAVDAEKVRAAADAMVASGLAAHGYQYINIDDTWEGTRDATGAIQTNDKFPDMRGLADYVHSKGLKIGLYSSPGPKTCAGFEGSFDHEEQDAASWANWGFDYIKYDWCSCQSKDLKQPYQKMRDALDKADRDIVYSFCQYGMGKVWEWGAMTGGNLWRTTGDITDTWGSLSTIGFKQADIGQYASPGHWNDPDMLIVGKVGWGPKLHPTRLAPVEQQTHITIWCMAAAPLLIGCDMTQLDEFTLDLLTNDEVLDVDQDELGKAAIRVSRDEQTEVWSRPLADGTIAVALFNRAYEPATVTAKWSDLKLSGAQPVRDLWQQKDLPEANDAFSSQVPAHGSVLVKIGRPKG
jgi:alpha-galactosidase